MELSQLRFLLKVASRETRAHIRDFTILILCIFLGVFVISFVQITANGLENGLRRDGKTILGGDVAIRNIYNPLEPDVMEFLEKQGTVSQTIEMRGLVQNRKQERTSLSEIKAIDDQYPLFGDFILENAGNIQNLNEHLKQRNNPYPYIVLDKALSQKLKARAGDEVKIGSEAFIIKDIIQSEPDRAGGGTFSIGPRSIVRKDALKKTGLIVEGSQVYYHYKIAFSPLQSVDVFEEDLNAQFPQASWRLLKYTNASPRIQRFLDQLSLFFLLVGLSALLIGGVGIGNAVKVVLEKRLHSIAVMKSGGASVSFVFFLWMIIVLMTGFIGIIPALALSHIAPFALLLWIGEMIPVAFAPRIEATAILQTSFIAIAILMLFSVLTLSRASRTKPALLLRQGLRTGIEEKPSRLSVLFFLVLFIATVAVVILTSYRPYFTASFLVGAGLVYAVLKLTSLLLVFLLKRLSNVKNVPLKLAIKNLTRPNHQTFTILLSLGLALTLFTTIALIEFNVKNRIADDIPKNAPAFFFIDIQKSQMDEFEQLLSSINGVEDIRKVPNLRGRIRYVNGVEAGKALVDQSKQWLLRGDRGFTYLAEKPEYSDILEGEWWDKDYAGEPLVSIVEDVAEGFDIGAGDNVTVNIMGRSITAKVANVRSVDWSTMTINYAFTFAPGVLDNAPHSYLATISVPEDMENEIMNQIARNFPNVTAIQVRDALQTVSDILGKIALAMRAIAFLALLTGVFVLAASILSSLRQRRYETILIKVLGGRPKLIISVINTEFIMLGLIAAAISLLLGSAAAYAVVVKVMDFPWQWDGVTALSVLAISLAITLSFSLWAMTKSLQSKPADFLRNE